MRSNRPFAQDYNYKFNTYKAVPETNGCEGCDLEPPFNQICYVNIVAPGDKEHEAVCAKYPIIFKLNNKN